MRSLVAQLIVLFKLGLIDVLPSLMDKDALNGVPPLANVSAAQPAEFANSRCGVAGGASFKSPSDVKSDLLVSLIGCRTETSCVRSAGAVASGTEDIGMGKAPFVG